jgi:glycosyltransferase involved in cell wall biosynthesis
VVVTLLIVYGLFALIGWSNLLFMRRPTGRREDVRICVLIPARDEAANLSQLLPALLKPNPSLKVIVFDDESSDATAEVARREGARVVAPAEPLPVGWTGKNRACHQLALAAAETEAEWFLFLDADVRPTADFIPAMSWLCREVRPAVGMITGFPTIIPGRGIEPLFLAWVGWVLIVSNPYALVSRTGRGHNRFKNGQVHCWRRELYLRQLPNEKVKDRIMEDVGIGRLMAREGLPVEVANLSSVLSVKMYTHWRETLDGMSKNSYEITNTDSGTLAIAAFFLLMGWGWAFAGHLALVALGLLALGGLSVVLLVRTAIWPVLLMPILPTIGAFTMVRSMIWHRRGTVHWKGRIYPGRTEKAGTKTDKAGSTPAES